MWSSQWIDSAAELLLGARCACCARPGRLVCDECSSLLRAERPAVVPQHRSMVVVAAGRYQGPLRDVVLSAKERGGLGALPLLSERLAAAVAALAFSACRRGLLVLVPVPSTRSASAQRGIDFTSALAVGAARQLRKAGIPVVVWKGLRQIRQRADQARFGSSRAPTEPSPDDAGHSVSARWMAGDHR